jgi:hypothetical protein
MFLIIFFLTILKKINKYFYSKVYNKKNTVYYNYKIIIIK